MSVEQVRIESLTEEEERVLLATQKRQNKIFGWILAGLALFFVFVAYFIVVKLGVIPMEDQDIFRST
mgnify:CR=1 FL=1